MITRCGVNKEFDLSRKTIKFLVYLSRLAHLDFRTCKTLPTPGLEPGPHWDVVLSHACLPIPSRGQAHLFIHLVIMFTKIRKICLRKTGKGP